MYGRFDLSLLQGAAQHLERAQAHGVQVFCPLAGVKEQDKAGRVLAEMGGTQQFAIGAVGEMLVAEDEIHGLLGENLPGVADGEAGRDSGGGGVQCADQGT